VPAPTVFEADRAFAADAIRAFLAMGACPSGYDRRDLLYFADRLSQAGPLPASGTDAALSTPKDPDHSGPPVVAQPLCRSADRERRDGTAAQTSGRRVQAEGVTAGETAVPVNDDAIPEYLAVAYEMLDSARSSAPVPSSICKARASASDPPQECDWPFCGCDPVADKVLDAIRESGRFVLVSSGGW
jgi:hypothetical protein